VSSGGEVSREGTGGPERDVVAFLIKMFEALPDWSIDEIAQELSQGGIEFDPRDLRQLLIRRSDLFVASRRMWRLRATSDPSPAPAPERPPVPRAAARAPTPVVSDLTLTAAAFAGGVEGSPGALERDLRDRMRGRRLAAEVDLTAALLERTDEALESLVKAGLTSRQVAHRYPALLVTYLVGNGVYHYSGGFWNALSIEGIDVSWGPAFADALSRLDLETFEDMVFGDNALRFVGPILAHGGIPKYCLPDYFRLLIRHLGQSSDADDLLATWRTRQTTFVGIDVPVRRFLLYGGDLAVDFIDRSIDLVRETARTGEPPRPTDVGLPPYVVLAFRRFLSADQPKLSSPAGSPRLPRPKITLDPWSPSGVTLTLPPLTTAGDSWAWRLQADGQLDRFSASRFAGREVPLCPARGWSVDLLDSSSTLLDLAFEGLNDLPVLFFDPSNGELVRPAAGLRYEEIWVLRPTDAKVVGILGSGQEVVAHVSEELPDPTGAWSGFKLQSVRLDGLRAIGVRGKPADPWRRLTVRPVAERPALQGPALPGVTSATGQPVYAVAPVLVLPPGSWLVRVAVDGDPQAPLQIETQESEPVELRIPPGCHDIGLVARGTLGADLRARFATSPDLHIERPQRLLFPGDRSAAVTAQSSLLSIDGNPPGQLVTVDVPEGTDEGWFQISDGDRPAIPLSVRVSKVLWSLGRTGTKEVSWGQEPVVLAADELGGTDPASLLVRTGLHDLSLRLDLSDGRQTLQESAKVAVGGADGRWRFDLGRFSESVERSDAPLLSLHLWVGSRPVSVAKIRQSLEISDLRAVSRIAGDFTQVDLTFDEGRVLENRVARLWSITRPWDPPISEQVPSGQSGHVEIGGYGRIRAGHYLAEVAVDDGWTSVARPSSSDQRCSTVQVGTPNDLLARLRQDPFPPPLDVLESIVVTGRAQRRLEPSEIRAIGAAAIDVAVRMLDGEVGRHDASSAGFPAVHRMLTSGSSALGEALVACREEGRRSTAELLPLTTAYLREFQPAEEEMSDGSLRALWQVAPSLAAAQELRGQTGPERASRLAEFTGWDENSGSDPSSGGPVTQLYIGIPPEQMATLQRSMDLVPGPVLSPDELVAAHFEWLLAEKARPGLAERWWRTHRRSVRDAQESTDSSRSHLVSRQPPGGTVEWAALPQLVLQAAIAIVANSPSSDAAVRALWEAAAFAPRLVTHDLVLAQILQRATAPGEPTLDQGTPS